MVASYPRPHLLLGRQTFVGGTLRGPAGGGGGELGGAGGNGGEVGGNPSQGVQYYTG